VHIGTEAFAVAGTNEWRIFDVDQRRRLRSCCWITGRVFRTEWDAVSYSKRTKATKPWWPSFIAQC
jgi:hypothetical protein